MTITYQGRKYTSDGRARLKICSGAPKDATAANGFKLDSDGRIYARVKADNGPLKGSNTGVEGFRFDASGALLIATAGSTDYKHNGFAFRKDGAVYVTSNAPSGQAWQGLGRDSRGYLCVEGLAAAWDLTSSLTGITGDAFTCTRGSTATYFGPDGLLRTAAIDEPRFDHDPSTARINLALRSEDLTNSTWVKASTSVNTDGATSPFGGLTADKLTENTSNGVHTIAQTMSIAPARYTLSVYAKAAGRNDFFLELNDGKLGWNGLFHLDTETVTNTTSSSAKITAVGDGWYRCSITTNSDIYAGGTRRIFIYLDDGTGSASYTGDGSSGIYFWGFQLEQDTVATQYIPTTSSIAGTGATPRGLLLEEQRTNLCLQSENFSSGSWTKTQSTVTENAIIAPDGATTADSVIESVGSSVQYAISSSIVIAAGTTYTWSVYAKAGSRARMAMQLGSGAAWGEVGAAYQIFNLSTGALQASGNLSDGTSGIQDVGNGWYRCYITMTAAQNTTSTNSLYLISDAGGFTYVGDGSNIYIWGSQFEAGSFPTSYIPTTSATVTRSADVVQDLSAPYLNASNGTLYVDSQIGSGVGNNWAAQVDDGTNNNRVAVFVNTTPDASMTVVSDGTTVVSMGDTAGTAPAALSSIRMCGAYAINDFAFSVNGGALAVDGSGGIPVMDRFVIGSSRSSIYFNGWIKAIAYYNKRLDNAELVGLSK